MTGAAVDLAGLGGQVERTDTRPTTAARAASPADPGAGRLDDLRDWLAATSHRHPPAAPARARCIVVGEVRGRAHEVAAQVGAGIRPLLVADGTTVSDALALGAARADDEVDSGTDLLIVATPDSSVSAAMLVGVLTGAEPVALLPRGPGAVDSVAWITRAESLRDMRRGVMPLRSRPDELLAALDEPALTATCGLVMRAVARRTPVVLDGTDAAAAALLCHDVQARAGRWWRFADVSPDPVHTRVVTELGQDPLLALGTSSGDGVAGLLALPLLRAAAARPTGAHDGADRTDESETAPARRPGPTPTVDPA